MLVITNLIFIIFETPFFWIHYCPAISIVHFALFIATWIFLTATQWSDPGIIKRIPMGQKTPDPNNPPLQIDMQNQNSAMENSNEETRASIYTYFGSIISKKISLV